MTIKTPKIETAKTGKTKGEKFFTLKGKKIYLNTFIKKVNKKREKNKKKPIKEITNKNIKNILFNFLEDSENLKDKIKKQQVLKKPKRGKAPTKATSLQAKTAFEKQLEQIEKQTTKEQDENRRILNKSFAIAADDLNKILTRDQIEKMVEKSDYLFYSTNLVKQVSTQKLLRALLKEGDPAVIKRYNEYLKDKDTPASIFSKDLTGEEIKKLKPVSIRALTPKEKADLKLWDDIVEISEKFLDSTGQMGSADYIFKNIDKNVLKDNLNKLNKYANDISDISENEKNRYKALEFAGLYDRTLNKLNDAFKKHDDDDLNDFKDDLDREFEEEKKQKPKTSKDASTQSDKPKPRQSTYADDYESKGEREGKKSDKRKPIPKTFKDNEAQTFKDVDDRDEFKNGEFVSRKELDNIEKERKLTEREKKLNDELKDINKMFEDFEEDMKDEDEDKAKFKSKQKEEREIEAFNNALKAFENYNKSIQESDLSLGEGQDGGLMTDYEESLSNFDIEKIMNNYENFLGVFSSDHTYKPIANIKPNEEQGFILNLETSDKGGSHWVAVFVTPASVEYMDSFARPAPKNIYDELKTIPKKMKGGQVPKYKHNTKTIQDDKSVSCGYIACKFLMERFRGKSFKQATNYTIDKSEDNAEAMQEKFKYMI